jgi:type IV secretion system protein VirB11
MLSVAEPSSTAAPAAVRETSALELALRPLRPLLSAEDVTELCINRPGEAYIESSSGWQRQTLDIADLAWCHRFAKLIANSTRQRVDESAPLLSAWLPGGERVQIALPPATTAGCIAITIRRPAGQVWSIGELAAQGSFRATRSDGTSCNNTEPELRQLLASREFPAFLSLAVKSRKNILVSGPTGSGKTTWTKALIREIPVHERLVTIEDAHELVLDRHPNHVRLYYSKDEQGLARVSPRKLLEASLRMRPDRILLAELRAAEAYDYLRNVNSGHPGSVTSVHAASAELAFEQLVLLVKQSDGGRGLSRTDIRSLLYMLVDVVIQCGVECHRRFISEIWYAPERRLRGIEHLPGGRPQEAGANA